MLSTTNSHFLIKLSTTKRYIKFSSKMLSTNSKSHFIILLTTNSHFFIKLLTTKHYIEFSSKILSTNSKFRFIFSKTNSRFFIKLSTIKRVLIKIEVSILSKLILIPNRIFQTHDSKSSNFQIVDKVPASIIFSISNINFSI